MRRSAFRILIMETVRIWLRKNQFYPMNEINEKGLEDVVFEAIALEDVRPQGAILVDLAVLGVGLPRFSENTDPSTIFHWATRTQ